MLIIGRVFMGLAGCIPATLGGGVIGDVMSVEERGAALSAWSSGQLLVRLGDYKLDSQCILTALRARWQVTLFHLFLY